VGHVAEHGEDGSVLLLLRCGARGHRPQEALLDLFALRLTVVLGSGTTTFEVVIELAYHVRNAVLLRRLWVGSRVACTSLAKLEGARESGLIRCLMSDGGSADESSV
jgi:hypothetical protein